MSESAAGIALPRGHAHRQPRGHLPARPPGPARGRPRRRRGHPPHGETAAPLRHPPPHHEPARAQRAGEGAGARRAGSAPAPASRSSPTPARRRCPTRVTASSAPPSTPASAWRPFPARAPSWRPWSSSGLPTDAFVFAGFPRPEAAARAGLVRVARATNAGRWCSSRPLTASAKPLEDALAHARRPPGGARPRVDEAPRGSGPRLPFQPCCALLGEPRGEFTVVLAGRSGRHGERCDTSRLTVRLLTEFGRLTENGWAGARPSANSPERTACGPATCLPPSIAPAVLDPFGPFANVAPPNPSATP